MTPAERAVIDAARALVPVARATLNSGKIVKHDKAEGTRFGWDIPPVELDKLMAATDALESAVRALPRPLSEQLAELRPGAVLEDVDGRRLVLLADIAKFREFACEPVDENGNNPSGLWVSINHSDVARVISNPEADRG